MRLLALTNAYPPLARGGYGEICADVMDGLARRGHDVTALSCGERLDETARQAPARVGEVAVRRELDYVLAAWRRPRRAWAAERHDARLLRRELERGVDAVLVWHLRGIVKPPLRLLHRAGVPVLYMLHDRWVLYERPGSVVAPWARVEPIARRLLREPPIARDGIVCFNSEWLRDEHARLGWIASRSHVVRCGLPAELIERTSDAPAGRGTTRLLFAGRVDPSKGVHDAIEALGRLPRDVTLSIAGPAGPRDYEPRLRAEAAAAGVTDRVRWLGELPRDGLLAAFATHDVLVYPSIEPESFGLGILEGQAAGLISVTSARGGPREFLADGSNCLIHDPGDVDGLAAAVRRLRDDPALAERLRAAGRQTAASMPVEDSVGAVERLLAAELRRR